LSAIKLHPVYVSNHAMIRGFRDALVYSGWYENLAEFPLGIIHDVEALKLVTNNKCIMFFIFFQIHGYKGIYLKNKLDIFQ